MKRYAFVGAIVLTLLIGTIAAPAYAGPKSFFKGMFETFTKQGKVLEIRQLTDSSYDIILLTKDDKIKMLKIKDKDSMEQTTLRKYNMEKIKALAGGADRAFAAIEPAPQFKKLAPAIYCIGLREGKEDGRLQYVLGAYMSTGGFRKLWIVDTRTWNMDSKGEEDVPDPREEAWSVEEKAAGNNNYPKDLIGKGAVNKEGQAQGATVAPAGKQEAPAATKAKGKGKGKGKGKKKQANQGEGEQ